MRSDNGRPAKDGQGWLHELAGAGERPLVLHQPRPKPDRDWGAIVQRFRDAITEEQVRDLAVRLGVDPIALRELGIGWTGTLYSWPMYGADGSACGIRTRSLAGEKKAVSGSRLGVVRRTTPDDGLLLVCEGESDTAAALSLGFDAIGVPGAGQCADIAAAYGRGRDVVIVADQDAAGAAGAERLAAAILKTALSVRIVAPPPQAKDLRAWLQAGATREAVQAAIDAAQPQADQWLTPEPIDAEVYPSPLRVGELLPPGLEWLGEYWRDLAESYQVPVELPALLGLGVLAGAAQRSAEVHVRPGWREPLSIWSLPLLPPGNRKSPVLAQLLKAVHEWERAESARVAPARYRAQAEAEAMDATRAALVKRIAKGDASADGELTTLAMRQASHVVPTLPRIHAADATPEALASIMADGQTRALLASAEGEALAQTLGRYSDTPRMETYLAAWSGDSVRIDRRGRSEHLQRPALSWAVTCQPEAARAMFGSGAASGRGLLDRFLVAAPRSTLGHRDPRPPAPDAGLQARWDATVAALLARPVPADPDTIPIVGMTAEARRVLEDLLAAQEPRLGEKGDLRSLAGLASKLPGTLARIAGVYAVAAGRAEIDADTMLAALGWYDWLIEARRATDGVLGLDPVVHHARRVLDWLRRTRPDRPSKRDIYLAARSATLQTVEEIEPVLALLCESGYLAAEPPAEPARRGRPPSPRYRVHPGLLGGAL